MRKNLSLGLILASTLALGTLAVAAPAPDGAGRGDGPHGHGHEHGQLMALRKLDLSGAQRASVRQIMQTQFASHKAARQALARQRMAFESMTPEQVGYQAAAASLAQAEGDATRARVQQQANVRAQVYAILTPAQKAQLATLQAQRQTRRQQWQQFRAEHAQSAQPGAAASAQ